MDITMKMICTICARAGSQGVKNKNIISFLGKPLVAHTIIQAQQSHLFDHIVVSTDSIVLKEIALQYGVDFVVDRPAVLATATAAKIPAIQHAVECAEMQLNQGKPFDIIMDLDVTSPLREVFDVQNAMQQFKNNHTAENLISVTPSRRSPYFNMVEVDVNGAVRLVKPLENKIIRRQDAPKCYDMNASIYIWRRTALFSKNGLFSARTEVYLMPEERSYDIDSELDLEIVRMIGEKTRVTLNNA